MMSESIITIYYHFTIHLLSQPFTMSASIWSSSSSAADAAVLRLLDTRNVWADPPCQGWWGAHGGGTRDQAATQEGNKLEHRWWRCYPTTVGGWNFWIPSWIYWPDGWSILTLQLGGTATTGGLNWLNRQWQKASAQTVQLAVFGFRIGGSTIGGKKTVVQRLIQRQRRSGDRLWQRPFQSFHL